MPQGNPRPGEKYRHFKNKMYQIVCLAHHSETDERLVVYQALYGEFGICARPFDMFISEVDHEKYPEVEQKYRFEYVETESDQPYWAKEEQAVSASEATEIAPMEEVVETVEEKMVGTVVEDVEQEPVEEGHANPWLLKFLDAETYEEKYELLSLMYREIDDKLIDDIAVCMDIAIPEGSIQERFMQLKQCLRTKHKYEGTTRA